MKTFFIIILTVCIAGLCFGDGSVDFYSDDCGYGYYGTGDCTRVCRANFCTGTGVCKRNNYCSCTGCNCFPLIDCGFGMGACRQMCRRHGCRGANSKCVDNKMCCCDGCGYGYDNYHGYDGYR